MYYLYGVSLKDKVPSVELSERMGIKLVTELAKRKCLIRWLGHVLWKNYGDWMKRSMLYKVDSERD